MNFSSNKKNLLVVSSLGIAAILVLYAGIWLIYNEAIEYFYLEVDRRMEALAKTTSSEIAEKILEVEPETKIPKLRQGLLFGSFAPPVYSIEQEVVFMQSRLQEISKIHELQEISILDSAGKILVSSNENLKIGQTWIFNDLFLREITLAKIGFSSRSQFEKSGNEFLKIFFEPVEIDSSTTFVLCLEVGVGTFQEFIKFEDKIFFTGIICLGIVLILVLVQIRLYFQISANENQMIKNENLLAMGRMAAGIAHEIRNPLGIIKTTAQRLQKKYGKETNDPIFGFIDEEVDRLNTILTNYLEFAKNDEKSKFVDFDLKKLIFRLLSSVKEEFLAQSIEISFLCAEEEVVFSGNPPQLQQVFLNFLINSRDAFSGRQGKILIELKKSKNKIEIVFEDDGNGISRQNLKSIFEPFFTTKSTGSGLGLYLSRRIVKNHNGEIEVFSDGKSWARFVVIFSESEKLLKKTASH
ncbi:ATP-binding protein [bacterium]|nr:ATP-binding protein [bacterium]